MYRPKWPYLLGYGSRDTRRIDFPRVDGLSMDPRVLGRHRDRLQEEIQKIMSRKKTASYDKSLG